MVADTNLFPGFYVLGEISSLGKTTFVFQLSVAGEHTFYFSFEKQKFEFKRLFFLTAKSNKFTAFATMKICEGVRTPAFLKAIEKFIGFGRNIIIYQ